MPTGYEGYQLSELERIAYESQNFLAQEVLARCSSTVKADYKREVRAKQGVWKQDERKEPT